MELVREKISPNQYTKLNLEINIDKNEEPNHDNVFWYGGKVASIKSSEGEYVIAARGIVSCDLIAKERERFITELRKIPNLKVWDSRANFVLCLISEDSKINATELTEKLLTEHNIFIKDLSTKKCFAGKSYIRLAVRNTEDNNKLLKVLNELM